MVLNLNIPDAGEAGRWAVVPLETVTAPVEVNEESDVAVSVATEALPETVRFLDIEADPVIVVISATPLPRAVLPDEVNKFVTVSLLDEVLPETVRFLDIEADPVIVVVSATPSPRAVLPDTAKFVDTVARPVCASNPEVVGLIFVANVDVRNEFDTAGTLLNKTLLPEAEI